MCSKHVHRGIWELAILQGSTSSYIGGDKYFKWHPVLIIANRVDILNIGLFDRKSEAFI